MHKVIFSIIVLFCCFSLSAQEIKVKSMELLQSDLSARTNPRLDGNDEPCALIKVIVPAVAGMQFEGWVIGNVGYRPGEYQVYVPAGTKKITFRHPDYAPGEIRFTIPIEGKCTYRVVLETPKKVGGLESVEKGDATAMLKQAKNYEQGTGSYSRNIEQAQEWYEKAAEAGSIEAQGYLAEVLYKGTKGFTRHQEKALKWNEVCAQRGNEKSIYRTAELYKELKKNEQAIAWYQKYNELHPDKDLQMQIAQLHSENHPERNKWLQIAADNGHVEAAYELATRLTPSNVKTASVYYQKAVDGKHAMAMYTYGKLLLNGRNGFEKNEQKGEELINCAMKEDSIKQKQQEIEFANETRNRGKRQGMTTITVNGAIFNMVPVRGKQKNYMISEMVITKALYNAVMYDIIPTQQDYSKYVVFNSGTLNNFINKLNKLTNRKFRAPTRDEITYAITGGHKKGQAGAQKPTDDNNELGMIFTTNSEGYFWENWENNIYRFKSSSGEYTIENKPTYSHGARDGRIFSRLVLNSLN